MSRILAIRRKEGDAEMRHSPPKRVRERVLKLRLDVQFREVPRDLMSKIERDDGESRVSTAKA